MNGNNGNGSEKLAAMQKRIDRERRKMAAEKERLREQHERETERLYRLVGESCCKAAKRPDAYKWTPDAWVHFGPVLKGVLDTETTNERARAFLREKGLLPDL